MLKVARHPARAFKGLGMAGAVQASGAHRPDEPITGKSYWSYLLKLQHRKDARYQTGFGGSPAFARAASSLTRCSDRWIRKCGNDIPSSRAFAFTAALLHFKANAARAGLAPSSRKRFNFWIASSVHFFSAIAKDQRRFCCRVPRRPSRTMNASGALSSRGRV